MKTACIFDLDGTLCDDAWRKPYITDRFGRLLDKPDWESYFGGIQHDLPIRAGLALLNSAHRCGLEIHIVTSRGDNMDNVEETQAWLDNAVDRVPLPNVHFRRYADGSERASPAYAVKHSRLLDIRGLPGGRVVTFAMDDDPAAAAMYEVENIPVVIPEPMPWPLHTQCGGVMTDHQRDYVFNAPYPDEAYDKLTE